MKKTIIVQAMINRDKILSSSGKWVYRRYAHFDFKGIEGATHIETLFKAAGMPTADRKYRITIEAI